MSDLEVEIATSNIGDGSKISDVATGPVKLMVITWFDADEAWVVTLRSFAWSPWWARG